MKRTVDTLFALIPPGATVLVALIFQWQLEQERAQYAALYQAYGAQGKTLGQNTLELRQASEAHERAAAELALCHDQANGLADRLHSAERMTAALECEIERLKPLRQVSALVVHHTAGGAETVPTVDRIHRQERGWDAIGYHYLITNGRSNDGIGCEDGEIQIGRHEDTVGAHAKHRNAQSIGVCVVGTNTFTDAQLASLQRLMTHLCRRHGITPSSATIQRHHERCPGSGLNLEAMIQGIARTW